MKKRILALLLCICMASVVFVYTFAEGNRQGGDVNGDGKVSSADAALVLRYCVYLDYPESTRQKMFADADCDGAVRTEDAAAILRQIVGLAPLQPAATDTELLAMLNQQSFLWDDDLTEWATRFIQAQENENVEKLFRGGAQYMGTPYGSGTGQMDCSRFVSSAFAAAGIPKSVYPRKNSDGTWKWFQTNHPEQLHETDPYSWQDWKPGCVLIYVNQETNLGNHLAIYVGEIDGDPIVMESRSGGVRIGYLMKDYYNKQGQYVLLTYYVDPLG